MSAAISSAVLPSEVSYQNELPLSVLVANVSAATRTSPWLMDSAKFLTMELAKPVIMLKFPGAPPSSDSSIDVLPSIRNKMSAFG